MFDIRYSIFEAPRLLHSFRPPQNFGPDNRFLRRAPIGAIRQRTLGPSRCHSTRRLHVPLVELRMRAHRLGDTITLVEAIVVFRPSRPLERVRVSPLDRRLLITQWPTAKRSLSSSRRHRGPAFLRLQGGPLRCRRHLPLAFRLSQRRIVDDALHLRCGFAPADGGTRCRGAWSRGLRSRPWARGLRSGPGSRGLRSRPWSRGLRSGPGSRGRRFRLPLDLGPALEIES